MPQENERLYIDVSAGAVDVRDSSGTQTVTGHYDFPVIPLNRVAKFQIRVKSAPPRRGSPAVSSQTAFVIGARYDLPNNNARDVKVYSFDNRQVARPYKGHRIKDKIKDKRHANNGKKSKAKTFAVRKSRHGIFITRGPCRIAIRR